MFSKLFFTIRKGDRMGIYYEIYKELGAHSVMPDGVEGTEFAVWAPNAKAVSVVGEFNAWNENASPMIKEENGVFKIFLPEAREGMLYKYCITTEAGERLLKADPFANATELRPGTSSKIANIFGLRWNDRGWLEKRRKWDYRASQMLIYEVHIGSWKKCQGSGKFYNYREFAHGIADYVIDMGYTHVELMGIAEHPYDGSWGYQVTGYYAPTSRYGSPEDFAYMIDYLHQKNIGVILDWVPAHFAKDANGLAEFDGTPVFEYADKTRGEHAEWGTKVFDYGKEEVKNFLIANALFWVEQYHVDGIRVDAVASMLYLDYGKEYNECVLKKEGENYNLEAIELLKNLNSVMKIRNPGVVMIAEESSVFPKVTELVENGGLGFDLKWNMGWMHDFTEYMKMDQESRKKNHYDMTFASSYMYDENYMLVISHDEVVHLKQSMLNKMYGFMDEKYAELRTAYAFMIGHPGKKLLFMGQEFAQYSEWDENSELEWYLLEDRRHKGVWNYWKDLLDLYKKNQALYELDFSREGFEWINADDHDRSVYSFARYSENKEKKLLFVCNFSSNAWKNYRIGVPEAATYKLILNSDDVKYGGEGMTEKRVFPAEIRNCDGRRFSFSFDLPAYSAVVFEF